MMEIILLAFDETALHDFENSVSSNILITFKISDVVLLLPSEVVPVQFIIHIITLLGTYTSL